MTSALCGSCYDAIKEKEKSSRTSTQTPSHFKNSFNRLSIVIGLNLKTRHSYSSIIVSLGSFFYFSPDFDESVNRTPHLQNNLITPLEIVNKLSNFSKSKKSNRIEFCK